MRNLHNLDGMTFDSLFEADYFSQLRLNIDGIAIDSRNTLAEMIAKVTTAESDPEDIKKLPAFQALEAYNTAIRVARSTIKSLLQFHPGARVFNTDEALVVKEPNPVLYGLNPFHPEGAMIQANAKTHTPDFQAMTRLTKLLIDLLGIRND